MAIRFPVIDSDTDIESDGPKRGQPVHPVKLVRQAGNGATCTSHGGGYHSSRAMQYLEEWKTPEKRHNLSETFEPWSDMKEPVKKAARNETSFVPHVSSAVTRSVRGSSSKPVYQSSSTNERELYSARSAKRRENVLSSAMGVPPKAATIQMRDKKLEKKFDASIESVGIGIKQLDLHSRSKTNREVTSGPGSSKATPASRSTASTNKPLQVARTKITGQSTESRSRTAGVKDVGRNSKLHTSNSTTSSLKSRSTPTSISLGAYASNPPTKPSMASSSSAAAVRRRAGQGNRPSMLRQSSRGVGRGSSQLNQRESEMT